MFLREGNEYHIFWDSNLNYNDTGIILSGKYSITYDQMTGKLCMKRNDHYVMVFGGDRFKIVLQ